jgi:hypothetical protein
MRLCRNNPEQLYDKFARRFEGMVQKYRSAKAAERRVAILEGEALARVRASTSNEDLILALENEQTNLIKTIADLVMNGNRAATTSTGVQLPKINDPPELSDGIDPTYEDWVLLMKRKLKGNADQYSTPDLRITYVVGRTKDQARKHLVPRLKDNAIDPYTDAEDIFEYLETIYQDVNKTLKAREKLRKHFFKMSEQFPPFLSEFMRLAAETELPRVEWAEELYRRLSEKLKMMVVSKLEEPGLAFKEFSGHCSRMASRLELMTTQSQRVQTSTSRSTGNSITRGDARTATFGPRIAQYM